MSDARPPQPVPMRREHALALLRQMLRIRRFEEKCAELYSAGQDPRLPAPLHRRGGGRGRRDAGARARTTRSSPPIASTATRSRAASRPDAIMAEMYGKAKGCSARARRLDAPVRRARAASTAATRSSAAACRSPSASRSPTRCRAGTRVTACFFGEGAVAEGEFHESLNLAALWKLPVLFLCENNLYAMGTALARSESADRHPCAKAAALRHAGRVRSTAWTCSRSRARARAPARQVRARRRAVLPRVPHLPLPRALDVRPRALPRQGRGRGVEEARSDRAPSPRG